MGTRRLLWPSLSLLVRRTRVSEFFRLVVTVRGLALSIVARERLSAARGQLLLWTLYFGEQVVILWLLVC